MIVGKLVRVFKDTYNTLAGYCDIDSVRTALEAYEQSKWVEFDVDDESTWPVVPDGWLNVEVIVHDAKNITDKVSHDYFRPTCGFNHYSDVTHWQYLPEFKE